MFISEFVCFYLDYIFFNINILTIFIKNKKKIIKYAKNNIYISYYYRDINEF